MTTSSLLNRPVPEIPVMLSWSGGPERITVGIADNEVLIRTGVRRVLDRGSEIVVVGEAGDGPSAMELARAHRPQVLLVDTRMPGMNGTATIRLIRRQVPLTGVVLLAAASGGELLVPALRAGASGFLFKDGAPDQLVTAVRVVAAGGTFLCPTATRNLVDHVLGYRADRYEQARRRVSVLATREREVLKFVAQGMGNAKIARVMSLSEGSIKAYVSRLLVKLRCDNRVQAALIAHDAALL
jgi:DNA-binding NarL/FixJ family response regulator